MEPVVIVVENHRATPAFFEAHDFCFEELEVDIEDPMGESLKTRLACDDSCAARMGALVDDCSGRCVGVTMILIAPGARVEIPWVGGIPEKTKLPDACTPTPGNEPTCLHFVEPPPGTYTATIAVYAHATCGASSSPANCLCEPDASGICVIADSVQPTSPIVARAEFELPGTHRVVLRIE